MYNDHFDIRIILATSSGLKLSRENNLTYQEAGSTGKVKQGRKTKVKMGIMPNFGKSDNTGLRVDAVTPGAPAYLAGMQKGDIIVAIESKEIQVKISQGLVFLVMLRPRLHGIKKSLLCLTVFSCKDQFLYLR